MSHAIHKVNGLVLDILPFGESGQIVKVFTYDLGLISLFANGIREEKGKLRYNLQILNLCEFDFVEGREVKRLTGVNELEKFEKILQNSKKRKIFSNTVLLLERLLIEEVENESLYENFFKNINYLNNSEIENFEEVEILFVVNILHFTGYWHGNVFEEVNFDNLEYIKKHKEDLVKNINLAIKSTHL
jgi:DNA repair protein RecO